MSLTSFYQNCQVKNSSGRNKNGKYDIITLSISSVFLNLRERIKNEYKKHPFSFFLCLSSIMSTILSNNNNNNNSSKLLTREEVLALARNEYARQLSNYTKAQLLKNKQHESNTKPSPARGIKDPQAKKQ